MGERTTIEWTDATWNPLRGTKGKWSCVKISEGCAHCYAERFNVRQGGPEYRVGADAARLDEAMLTLPLRWNRPRRVFVCSMTDAFGEWVPDDWLLAMFAVMYLAGQHTFQVLTKRTERMQKFMASVRPEHLLDDGVAAMKRLGLGFQRADKLYGRGPARGWPPDNLWLGVSVEDQVRADERIPWLLQTPAAVRFLSVEPLLGPVDISRFLVPRWTNPGESLDVQQRAAHYRNGPMRRIDWVIVGGESGGPPERALVEKAQDFTLGSNYEAKGRWAWQPKAEALEWVRSLRDQCVTAGVPFFFKQWGGPTQKSGGRLLDGKVWDQFPDGPNFLHEGSGINPLLLGRIRACPPGTDAEPRP